MDNSIKLIIAGFVIIVTFIIGFAMVDIVTIEGNQVGVKETWQSGVIDEPMSPKTYFLIPGFNQDVYKYDMGVQVYVMNDKDDGDEFGEGRRGDSYVVQSKDQQDMRISLRVQWKRLPDKVIALHKYARDQVEERVLRPAILNVVKNQATLRTALEAYAGEGLVKLQNDILEGLQNHPELIQYVRVETFVIEHIALNKEYTDQIVARQVAIQKKLRADEETKAALAEAEKAKAVARADYETQLVNAQRDKEKGILEAEKTAQQNILAATADAKRVELAAIAEKNRNIAIAEGERIAAENRAQAILALGQSEAESKRLQLLAYSVDGADSFVKIEIAKNLALAFQNIKGFLPEGMTLNVLTDQYAKGVGVIMNPTN